MYSKVGAGEKKDGVKCMNRVAFIHGEGHVDAQLFTHCGPLT